MNSTLSPLRVADLIEVGRNLSTDDMKVVLAAFALEQAKLSYEEMIRQQPEKYEHGTIIPSDILIDIALPYIVEIAEEIDEDFIYDHRINEEFVIET